MIACIAIVMSRQETASCSNHFLRILYLTWNLMSTICNMKFEVLVPYEDCCFGTITSYRRLCLPSPMSSTGYFVLSPGCAYLSPSIRHHLFMFLHFIFNCPFSYYIPLWRYDCMSTEDLDHGRFGPADNDYHVKFSLPPSTGFLREGCLLVFFVLFVCCYQTRKSLFRFQPWQWS